MVCDWGEKLQIPSTKLQRSSNFQIEPKRSVLFGGWILMFLWSFFIRYAEFESCSRQ
jgi:hypothetical protein